MNSEVKLFSSWGKLRANVYPSLPQKALWMAYNYPGNPNNQSRSGSVTFIKLILNEQFNGFISWWTHYHTTSEGY